MTRMTAPPKIAGITVIANGPDPGRIPDAQSDAVDHQRAM